MKIKIYQLAMERVGRRFLFMPLDLVGIANVQAHNYDLVYEGDAVNCKNINDVFCMFNDVLPDEYRGRSLSISDVVEIVEPEPIFYYCDTFDFTEIPFDSTKAKRKF